VNTGEVPEKVRAFVAIYPPTVVVSHLEAMQSRLRKTVASEAVRWTKPEQIHLTLQFLGYIKRDLLGQFETTLDCIAGDTETFSMCAVSVGCFPTRKQPRIIWAGFAGDLDPLQALKQKLDIAFSELGYVPEKRKFHPHLTIGRVADLKISETKRLAKDIVKFESAQFGACPVRKIHLMQSILSPKGAKYHVLKSFPLKTF
jgi:RNA 2',3'-cyclic 3'-phosphodiesterase